MFMMRMIRIMRKQIWAAAFCLAFSALACNGVRDAGSGDGTEAKGARRSEYRLLEGTALELTAVRIQGEEPDSPGEGGTLYIVGGIHGDEKAGWMAGELLKDMEISAGTLYIVSPANRYGAGKDQRNTEEDRDLNRNFPGDPDGCDAERIAWAIYSDIRDKKPDLALDLHEARPGGENSDALGNSVICQSPDGIGDLVLEILTQSAEGDMCSGAFTLYGSPPPGSINRIVTDELGIPVMTVETFREDDLEIRVKNHLEIARLAMRYCGLLGD